MAGWCLADHQLIEPLLAKGLPAYHANETRRSFVSFAGNAPGSVLNPLAAAIDHCAARLEDLAGSRWLVDPGRLAFDVAAWW